MAKPDRRGAGAACQAARPAPVALRAGASRGAARPPLLALLLLLAACTVRLISAYDEELDRRVTGFQQRVDTFLALAAAGAGPDFEHSTQFYAEGRAELAVIATRANAVDKNELTCEQVGGLRRAFADLQELHKHNRDKPAAWQAAAVPAQDVIDQACRAILRLELAKKRE